MEPLFTNLFPKADRTAWLTQVQKELKSEAAYESLRWQTDEGLVLEPHYTRDSLTDLPLDQIQSAQKSTGGWLNAPAYRITEPRAANALLRDALAQGADALMLNLTTVGVNASHLLNGIKLSDTPVFFQLASESKTLAQQPSDPVTFVRNLQSVAPYQLKGGLLLNTGDATAELTRLTADSPQFRTVWINSQPFHNAGATAVQELAFTLAALADAYDELTDRGLTVDQLIPKTMLSVSVGTSYFREMAKLRALRGLSRRFLSHYSSSTDPRLFIHCQTSGFHDAAVTPYTNLLRATTEAMAAVIGGCDALTVHPYDTVLGKSTETPALVPADGGFAERIARNVSLLLKEESYLDKVADPSAGSYYIETLTYQFIEAAWALFLDIEKRGGLAKARDFVQQDVDRAYQAKVEAVRHGNVLVGVTKFRTDEPSGQSGSVLSNTADGWPNRRLAREFE